MKDNTQPEALRLADALHAAVQTYPQTSEEEHGGYCTEQDQLMDAAATELCIQHARIADLEAQLEAIGAGGVSGPLLGQPQAMPDLSQLTERGAKAWAGVDAQGLREGRWYMVNKMGMATLCVEKEDAEKEAADAQRFWPHMGPHRAVRLVEASFEAADMPTAAEGVEHG